MMMADGVRARSPRACPKPPAEDTVTAPLHLSARLDNRHGKRETPGLRPGAYSIGVVELRRDAA